jgi:protease-4
MSDNKPGVFRRFFTGLWDAVNFTRRLVINLVFLVLLLIFVGAMFAGAPRLSPRTALVLDPKGNIVEQFRAEATERAVGRLMGNEPKEVQLRDLLRLIDAAAKDTSIERIVLIPDEISGAGVATLTELGVALDRFRTSGKEVVAVSNGMNQMQYLLATHADSILLHPDGSVMLQGFGSYRSYFKDLLDKLAVEVHLFRVGEYKSAAEPYILNAASADAREADLFWLNGLWQIYAADVSKQRKLPNGALQAGIENLPLSLRAANGDLAHLALTGNLVDQLATRDEARQTLIAKGEKDESGHTFRQVNYRDYLAMLNRNTLPDIRSSVAVVVAEGEIVGGDQQPGTVGGDSTAQLIRQAREDDNVKALVLRVNSPGGEVFASEQIRREVELTKTAGKPVVVSMGDVAASGGYWISMNADRIFAEPGTITGSIGIFGMFVNIPNSLAKIGVHVDGVGTTSLAGAFDVRRPLDPQLGEIIQTVIDKGYQDFIGRVATARGKKAEDIDKIARGRVWSGQQALERGLVDQLGGMRDAVTDAATRAKLGTDFQLRYIEKPLGTFDRFLLSMSESAMAHVMGKLELSVPQTMLLGDADLRRPLRLLQNISAGKPAVFAYCFCEVR